MCEGGPIDETPLEPRHPGSLGGKDNRRRAVREGRDGSDTAGRQHRELDCRGFLALVGRVAKEMKKKQEINWDDWMMVSDR